jgi:hypothetical protein
MKSSWLIEQMGKEHLKLRMENAEETIGMTAHALMNY